MDSQVEDLITEASLDEDQIEKLRRKYPREFQIIVNPTRLDLIAKDIVEHYMGRGYKGKAMVISVDRFTAVKMYKKVQFFWKIKIAQLQTELEQTGSLQKPFIEKELKYMKETDMAIVISNSQGEIKRFKEKGLDIRPHRKRIISEDLDVKFKKADDPLRIVFVCAMWMTGFDAPPVSTIYLDKPLRNHTLIQTISRANRVFEDKKSGMIVDYYGILRKLNEAIKIYGSGTGGGINEGDNPLRNIDELVKLVDQNVKLMEKYLKGKEVDSQQILLSKGFEQLRLIEIAKDAILVNDESKLMFLSLLRLSVNSYTDLLPDPRANQFRPLISLYIHIGKSIAADIPEIDIRDVEKRIQDLIVDSIAVAPQPTKKDEPIDLSKIDINQIKINVKKEFKRTEAEKLRSILNRKLAELLKQNKTHNNNLEYCITFLFYSFLAKFSRIE